MHAKQMLELRTQFAEKDLQLRDSEYEKKRWQLYMGMAMLIFAVLTASQYLQGYVRAVIEEVL